MAKYSMNSSPRNTYEIPKFYVIDAKISFLLVMCVLHFRWYTVGPTVLIAVILWYFDVKRNMNISSSIRWVRGWLIGPERPARSPNRRMKMVDFQRRGVYWRPYRERDWVRSSK